MRLLTDSDIQQLSWSDVLDTLERAFKVRARDTEAFILPERVAIHAPQGTYLTMPCADKENWFGVKQVSVIPDNPTRNKPSVQAWYTLFDPSGTPALACDATLLTRFRTSAVSAIAAKYLAPKDAHTLLVIGTGSLAPWMAEAHAQVRDYERILVWGRDLDKARITSEKINSRLGERAEVVKSLEAAAKEADVITLATTARKPILKGAWLRGSQHLDLVGAFIPEMAEVDADAVKNADVFVDDLDACTVEAGDLIQAQAQGWSFEQAYGDLGEVVTEKSGRQTPHRITLFKSVGLALEDLVVAKLVVDNF